MLKAPARLISVFLACGLQAVSFAEIDLVSPIGGLAFQDWTIVNYVDLDKSSGILDWRGGTYTYDGHDGIDYTLPNFAAMDLGVDVLAAQSGTVMEVHDGEYDRWSRVDPNPGVPANYVAVDHGSFVTYYYHLKAFSIPVDVGQPLAAGQKIGEVGSSGYSTDPHLHFSVYDKSTWEPIETYLDAEHWWQSPHAYAGDVFGVLDFGVARREPTLAELVDRPVDVDVFFQTVGSGQEAFLWLNLFSFSAGDQLDFYFDKPDGTEYAHWNWTTDDIHYGWWTAGITLPDVPDVGPWTIDVARNGEIFLTDSFLVLAAEPAPADFDQDGDVDGDDLLVWQNAYGANALADADGDSDGRDFLAWQRQFGSGVSSLAASPAVPEPRSAAMLSVILLGGLRGLSSPITRRSFPSHSS